MDSAIVAQTFVISSICTPAQAHSSTRLTCTADHAPPRAVGTPRPFSPAAICQRYDAPDTRTSATIGRSTARVKARVILHALNTSRLNPEWSLPSLLDQNPLVWMAEVNGMLVDLRHMPREVQEIAFQKGMIPYIPADQERGSK